MKPVRQQTMFVLLAGLAILGFIVGCEMATSAYGNKVVRVDEGKLTVEDKRTLAQETHEVAPDAKVTKDGQPAQLEDLKPGDSVEVKTEAKQDGKAVVTEIDAKSKSKEAEDEPAGEPGQQPVPGEPTQPLIEEPFKTNDQAAPEQSAPEKDPAAAEKEPAQEPAAKADRQSFEGRIVQAGDDQLVIAINGGERTFTVNQETEITKDGNPAQLSNLAPDDAVTVEALGDDDAMTAVRIEATSPQSAEEPESPEAPEEEPPQN